VDPTTGKIYNAEYIGEVNMGAPQTLGDFIDWAQNNYPAAKYVLFIKDHGAGWKAVSTDNTSGKDRIYMQELKSALEHSNGRLDLVVFDACLMAMVEVANQVTNKVDMMVGSEEGKYTHDFPYNSIFATLNSNPGWTGEQLAVDIVAKAKATRAYHTFSAVDCQNLNTLVNQIDSFAIELEAGVDDYDYRYQVHYDPDDNVQRHIRNQLVQAEHFDDANFIDLYHFAQLIKADAGIPDDYKTQAQPIMQSLQKGGDIIKAEKHGVAHPNAHGLSIYFPSAQTKGNPPVPKQNVPHGERPYDNPKPSHLPDNSSLAKYAFDPDDCTPPYDTCTGHPDSAKNHPVPPTPDSLFVDSTRWDEFLHRYYEPVADAGSDTVVFVGFSAILNGGGSSDADGSVKHWFWDFNYLFDDGPDCPPDTFEDWDRDCVDERDDDNWQEDSVIVMHCFTPGTTFVTLTVWDDHNEQGGTHAEHYETDQDSLILICLPVGAPVIIDSVDDQSHNMNGSYSTDHFTVGDGDGTVVSVTAAFSGEGVENVAVEFTIPPPAAHVEGFVTYDVVDHCQDGGTVTMVAADDEGNLDTCHFNIILINNPPVITCPDDATFPYNEGYSGWATGSDPDDEPITFDLVAGPAGLDVLPNGEITWVTDSSDVGGPYDVIVRAIDPCTATDQCAFQLTVTEIPVGCCYFFEYCDAMTEEDCMLTEGIWYAPPYQCIYDVGCLILCGDCTEDAIVNAADVVFLISYLFRSGPAPAPLCIGDVNCDALVAAGDIVYLIGYLFRQGDPPCPDCCGGKEEGEKPHRRAIPQKSPQTPGGLKKIE
jgi:hypothetical protein